MDIKMNDTTKSFLEEVSSLFGKSKNTIQQVWEYTLFTWILKAANNEGNATRIDIPYLGSACIKYKNETINENGEISADIDLLVGLSDEFKKMLYEAKNEDTSKLTEYVKQQYIKKLSE